MPRVTSIVSGPKVERVSEDGPSVLLSHPTGNQNVRNTLQSLAENGMLAEFWTTVAWDPLSSWNKIVPQGIRSQLTKRAYPEAPANRLRCAPSREIVRLAIRGSALSHLLCSGEQPFSVIGMYRHFDGKVADRVKRLPIDAVYAYEGGALQTFREAKRRGISSFYELPSSYWHWEHKLLSQEAERNPEFANLLPKLKDSPGHMAWKDEELNLADVVIAPSQHVRQTLAEVVPDEKIRVISYGAPPLRPRRRTDRTKSDPLSVLFVGSLSQRKGISYLLEAVDKLGLQVQLTLVGGKIAANTKVDAACARWQWFESLPHSEVLELMGQADVLVLPSLAEGCALVVLEALACGLPVVVTPNTGALEFVRDGYEGFVVPICDADAIAERLEELHHNRDLLDAMSRAAQTTAGEKSWADYRARLAGNIRSE